MANTCLYDYVDGFSQVKEEGARVKRKLGLLETAKLDPVIKCFRLKKKSSH